MVHVLVETYALAPGATLGPWDDVDERHAERLRPLLAPLDTDETLAERDERLRHTVPCPERLDALLA
ncbi:hypothetical protein ACFUMH_04070 [Cellulomonas sp. NPDC057328]|uniref:hypothetical protein n=1 Tax=Cellulomonas sp. NPDC057328 TaxID=3346101 RepID=UPI003634B537